MFLISLITNLLLYIIIVDMAVHISPVHQHTRALEMEQPW